MVPPGITAMVTKKRPWRLILATVIYAVASILIIVLYHKSQPSFRESTYRFAGGFSKGFSMPLLLGDAPKGDFRVYTTMRLWAFFPRRFSISIDQCLNAVTVNGVLIEDSRLPYCNWDVPLKMYLDQYLHTGDNSLSFDLYNDGGFAKLVVSPASFDRDAIAFSFPFVFATLIYGYSLFRILQRRGYWKLTEHLFLFLFLGCRFWLFSQLYGTTRGFDTGAHREMIDLSIGFNPFVDVQRSFYSYHPPVSFMLAQWVHSLGFSQYGSIFIVSFISSLVAFFLLREALRITGALFSFWGIAFLYLASSIPLQVYLASSVNMDAVVFMFATISLYCSVRLFWLPDEQGAQGMRRFSLLLILALAAALVTKFSAIFLLVIPFLVLLVARPPAQFPQWQRASGIVIAAVLLVFPYYLLRYYRQEGTFFPTNATTYFAQDWSNDVTLRDTDKMQFLKRLITFDRSTLFPQTGDIIRLIEHAYDVPRLQDAWKDVWIADRNPLEQSRISIMASLWYMRIAPWLAALGLLMYFLHRFREQPEVKMWLSVTISSFFIEVALLLFYGYSMPESGAKPMKAIYVPCIAWGIGGLMALGLENVLSPFRRFLLISRGLQGLALFAIATFVLVNHVLPVY